MATKRTGLSRDLIIHPGETIADILNDRGITQAELAVRTGVTPAYISNVISGKKAVSAKFALALEYALGVSKSFWMNLQAHYETELLEFNEPYTITDEERAVRDDIQDAVRYLRSSELLSSRDSIDNTILELRRFLGVSNLVNLKETIRVSPFRIHGEQNNAYRLAAWARICEHLTNEDYPEEAFVPDSISSLFDELKHLMTDNEAGEDDIKRILKRYGITVTTIHGYKDVPIKGFIVPRSNGSYQLVLSVADQYADTFWYSLFEQLGHICKGDTARTNVFIDCTAYKKTLNPFTEDLLMSSVDYKLFINSKDFSIESIEKFAVSQHIIPYIVINRLVSERRISRRSADSPRPLFKWAHP